MIKILFQIQDNKLFVQERKRLNTEQKSLINTNTITQNELVFSDEYISKNTNIINSFLHELVTNFNIDTMIIKEMRIVNLVLSAVKNIKNLQNLYLLEETVVNYKICESIIKTNSINRVSLYNIPMFLIELLDKERIIVESRNEILFLSNFMKENMLDNFSSIYYKTSINLSLPLSKMDEDDFLAFININKYLKRIYIDNLRKDDLENILDILEEYRLKNITIYIDQNIHDLELIDYLKKLNKKKNYGIKFKINYSEEYIEDNIMSQIHLNTIKLCIFIALFLVSSLVVFVFSSNYISMQKVDDIKDDINDIMAEYKEQKEEENKTPTEPEEPEEPTTPEENEPDTESPIEEQPEEPKKMTNDLQALLQINKDTVGWLKVNNTNVDYPVVQYTDNDYYLNRNFKGQKDNSGWVFMDYRADNVNLSQNTIIFGHNMYYSGVMFGTLYKAKYSSWYTKKENQIIEFDTLYENLKWQIFSIYVVPNTNDYLIADFSTEEKFNEFLNLITKRSIYNFNTPVAGNDKILTLSTCSNNGKNRLVIHAVLLDN